MLSLFLLLSIASDPLRDLPDVVDLQRFPDIKMVREQKRCYIEHKKWLKKLYQAWPEQREKIGRWIEQTEEAVFIWDVLEDCHNAAIESDRRKQLGKLKHFLRPHKYYTATVPALIHWTHYPPDLPTYTVNLFMPGAEE